MKNTPNYSMTKKNKYLLASLILVITIGFGVKASQTYTNSNAEDSSISADESGMVSMVGTGLDSTFRNLAQSIKLEENMAKIERMADYAAKFLGTRYRYGSTGPKTFDCSGFIGYIFKKEGINLPRTSRMQYSEGEKVNRKDVRPGDLLFFSSPRSGKGKVGHVAMVVDVNERDNSLTFIHASSSKGVSYQKFPDGGYYSRHYIGAKRIISDAPTA